MVFAHPFPPVLFGLVGSDRSDFGGSDVHKDAGVIVHRIVIVGVRQVGVCKSLTSGTQRRDGVSFSSCPFFPRARSTTD